MRAFAAGVVEKSCRCHQCSTSPSTAAKKRPDGSHTARSDVDSTEAISSTCLFARLGTPHSCQVNTVYCFAPCEMYWLRWDAQPRPLGCGREAGMHSTTAARAIAGLGSEVLTMAPWLSVAAGRLASVVHSTQFLGSGKPSGLKWQRHSCSILLH